MQRLVLIECNLPILRLKRNKTFKYCLLAFTQSPASINHCFGRGCSPALTTSTHRPGARPVSGRGLTREPWPQPLGQWGEAIPATTPAARATCCSGIKQLDTAIRMMEHNKFSTLTTPMALTTQAILASTLPESSKMVLLILQHRCFFVFLLRHP